MHTRAPRCEAARVIEIAVPARRKFFRQFLADFQKSCYTANRRRPSWSVGPGPQHIAARVCPRRERRETGRIKKQPRGSAQPLEKAQKRQENPRKSKPFPLIFLVRAWLDFAEFG
jgi:hypothetical protein